MCFIHYRGDQIHEAWNEFDAAGLMAQVKGEATGPGAEGESMRDAKV